MANFRAKTIKLNFNFFKMKTKLIVLALVLVAFLSTAFVTPLTKNTVSGTYEGTEEFNYVFTVTVKGEKQTMEFQYASDEVLENYDLDTDDYIGEDFTITYETSTEIVEDEDGNEEEVEVLTITDLVLNQ